MREARQDRMVRAMLEALTRLAAQLGPDLATYRWGALHTVRLRALAPGHEAAALPGPDDPLFASGYPRHGDGHAIDLSPFRLDQAADSGLDLSTSAGPVQRLVVDLAPDGPRARFALAGGAVEDPADPHFADELAGWRRNVYHDVPFAPGDVIAAAESRLVVVPPR
jgi:penicillin amidase